MGDSTASQVSDDLPASVVETEEPISEAQDAPLPDENIGSTESPPAKEAGQEKPKGDAPAEKDETTDGDGKEPKPDDDKSKSGKDAPRGRRNDPQKRIDRLTKARSDAEREAAYWRGRAEATEQRGAKAEEPQPDPKPKLDDYDSAEDYAEALADWKLEQAKEGPPASEQTPGQEPEPRSDQGRKPTEQEVKSYADAKLKYADLDDVLFDTSIPWTSHMADAVADMENAAEVLYHLGQDEAEVDRISKLAPRAQEREVWRFAENLDTAAGTTEKSDDSGGDDDETRTTEQQQTGGRKPQVSKASPVTSRVSGSAPSTKSLEDMSEAEYIAHMDQKDMERRQRGG